jgi:protein YibB
MIENNTTIITGLININREKWNRYSRDFSEYLSFFKNTLSLKSNMVIYIEKDLEDMVIQERKKIDPELNNTTIKVLALKDLPKYYLRERIEKVMLSEDYQKGLVEPDAPEFKKPDYSVLILSKTYLMEDVMNENIYNSEYFIWVDAGICHNHFNPNHLNINFPSNKINEVGENIRILCRITPTQNDLNLEHFYKSHQNRFGAGVIIAHKNVLKQFNYEMDKTIEEALNKNLIDSEQSFFNTIFLRQPNLFNIVYNQDWYHLFKIYT